MCRRPTYLQGLTEFFNRLYDGTRLESNTKQSGLVRVEDHYVSLAMATTDEGFRVSVTDEILRNGFLNRFVPLIGEGNPEPRRPMAAKNTALKELKTRLDKLNRTEVSFRHSERAALLASEAVQSLGNFDGWLTVRAEEHTLQVADLLSLDRQFDLQSECRRVSVEVAESDVLLAREFVTSALISFQNLVKITRIPHGALAQLYQFVHNLHLRHESRFTKVDALRALSEFRATEVENAINTAQEAGYIVSKLNKREGIIYKILYDPFRL
jgi:hypothetical protein